MTSTSASIMRSAIFLCIIIVSQQLVLAPVTVTCQVIEEEYWYNVAKTQERHKYVGYPRERDTGSGWGIWAVGAAVVGVATLVVAPYVAPAVASAVGFGSAGIAKGSTAAYLMSFSGGATQAGSIVALGQSIGAAGISASTAVASGMVGGAVGGSIIDGVMRQKSDSYTSGGYEYWTETITQTVWDSYTWEKCVFQQ